MTDKVSFLWVPGTGESYKDDVRETILEVGSVENTGYAIAAEFGDEIDDIWVGYDSTIGPAGGGIGGQDHYTSREIGRNALLAKARATEGWLIFGGYSQGAGIAWEVMQEIYAGKHPDLWPRMLCSVLVANPFRVADQSANSTTFVLEGDQADAFGGWGVANLLGTGITPRIQEFNLVNAKDMICNAAPDSFLRDVADLIEFMEFNEGSLNWGIKTYENVANVNWVAAAAGWLDIPNQIRRVQNTLREIAGYVSKSSNKHTSYDNRKNNFPVTQMDGTTGSLCQYLGRYLKSYAPYLITQAQQRGPVPPVVAYEDFRVDGAGWTGFTGNLGKARVNSGRAGQSASGINEVINIQGIHNATAPSDDYAIDVLLADVLQGQLDKGANGSADYFRIRNTATFGVGTAVEFRVRASGAVAISSVSGGTVTQKATGTGTFSFGHMLRFQAKNNVYSIINLTTGTTILTWTDTAGIVNTGPNNRRASVGQTSNHPFAQPQWSGYAFDSVAITDLSI